MRFQRSKLIAYKANDLQYPQRFSEFAYNKQRMNEEAYRIIRTNEDFNGHERGLDDISMSY